MIRAAIAGVVGLAPIATLGEAQAWASLQGKGATCEAGPNARTEGEAFELRRVTTSCDDEANGSVNVTTETIVRVQRDGRVETGPTRELGRVPQTGGCPSD